MQRAECPTIRQVLLTVAMLALTGCATAPPEPPPPEPPPPEPVVEVSIPIVKEPPPPPVIEPPLPAIEPLPSVAIVLGNRAPAYDSVVNELGQHFDRYSIYDLSDKSQPPGQAFNLINDSDTAAVIAIGLDAARTAIELADAPVIFGQVFNYQDFDLITESSRGVAAIAPLEAQLAAWQDVDSTVSRIGVILGEGHDDLIAEAQLAAQDRGLELIVRVTHSDQETQYFFKRMAAEIDGFWLFPDNRVLSARVIREIINDARRRNITVVVPSDAMLLLGAAISITTVPSDVAARIADVVRAVQDGRFASIPAITALSELSITTNENVLRKPIAFRSTELAAGKTP